MNHSKLIDELLNELSYRVGIVNLKNKNHQSIISEILSEWEEYDAKQIIMEFLTNEAPADTEGDDKDYTHLGAGIYVRKGDEDKESAQKYKKDDSGSLKAISDDEYQKTKSAQGQDGEKAAATTPQNQQGGDTQQTEEPPKGTSLKQGGYDKIIDKEAETRKKIDNETNNTLNVSTKKITPLTPKGNPLPNNLEKLFAGESASVKNVYSYITDSDREIFKEFQDDYRILVSLKNSEERQSQAEKMVMKYGLDSNKGSNEPNPKLYMRKVSPDARKILSGDGNKTSEELRDTIENALQRPIKGSTKKGADVKQEVTTTSKPDIGGDKKQFIRTAEQDENVRAIFSREPYSYLDQSMHQIMGPIDDSGNLLYPASKHSKAYLKQSIDENKSLQKTIDKLQELEESEGVKPEIRKALETHQNNMRKILETYEIPSKEASEAVGSSYAVMAETLNNESGILASAMMKNMAEMALYDTEIAAGDEAYLPSAGTFPSGDKLRVNRDGSGKIEKIAAVSVKYGKSGKFKAYGFPGETGQYQKFHPNPEYRDRLHSRPGDDGYDLGVKDSIIDNPIQLKQIIIESGFGEAITDQDGLIQTIQKMRKEIQNIKEDIGYIQNSAEARRAGKPTAKKQITSQKSKISELEKELSTEMGNFIDGEKLSELIGKDNAKLLLSRPQAMVCGLTFGSTLSTSNGLDTIEHNHQEIANGKYISHTDTAESGQTKSLKNWSLTWRAYDDRAGGLIAGANAERISL